MMRMMRMIIQAITPPQFWGDISLHPPVIDTHGEFLAKSLMLVILGARLPCSITHTHAIFKGTRADCIDVMYAIMSTSS